MTHAANGTTTTVNPDKVSCTKLADAGAVRIKWPADPERKEKESFTWSILQNKSFNKDAHLGWRLTKEELLKRAAAERSAHCRAC